MTRRFWPSQGTKLAPYSRGWRALAASRDLWLELLVRGVRIYTVWYRLWQRLESRLRFQGLAQGREGSEAELGVIVGQIRRSLSTSAVRAQALCLISRLTQMGDGARMAAKRREWVLREEARMRLERRAQWLADVRGRVGCHKKHESANLEEFTTFLC